MLTYGVKMIAKVFLSLYAGPRNLSGVYLLATGSRTPPLFLVIPVKGHAVEDGRIETFPPLFIFHLLFYLAVERLPVRTDAPLSPGMASP